MEIGCFLPTKAVEIISAITKLKNNKALRIDGITSEILKADIQTTTDILTTISSPRIKIQRMSQQTGLKNTKERGQRIM